MSDSDRKSVLRHLDVEQYDDIMRVCEFYPLIDMDVKVKSKMFFYITINKVLKRKA